MKLMKGDGSSFILFFFSFSLSKLVICFGLFMLFCSDIPRKREKIIMEIDSLSFSFYFLIFLGEEKAFSLKWKIYLYFSFLILYIEEKLIKISNKSFSFLTLFAYSLIPQEEKSSSKPYG